MAVIDYVNGHDEFDGSVWFKDGEYVGHDDQIDPINESPKNKETTLVVRHRTLRSELTWEEIDRFVGDAPFSSLSDVEHYLVPLEE